MASLTKVCFSCGISKPVSEFHRDGLRYKPWCKPCRKVKRRGHSNGRVGKQKELQARLRYRYGLTVEGREQMLQEQGGKCKICLQELTIINVDHCHKTGTIRGLLCRKCNSALGLFGDDVENLRRAIEYLG